MVAAMPCRGYANLQATGLKKETTSASGLGVKGGVGGFGGTVLAVGLTAAHPALSLEPLGQGFARVITHPQPSRLPGIH